MSILNDKFNIVGAMTATLIKEDGTTEVFKKNNLIVDVGFDFIADCIGKSTARPAVVSHIAVGTGTAAAAPADVALQNEINRQASTYSHTGGTKVFEVTASFVAGVATGALTEAGILNAASLGILLDRVVFPVINKGAADTLAITFTFTMS